MAAWSRRVMAPICRFSSTVWRTKVPRPCGTWAMPRRTICSTGRPAIDRPSKRMSPVARTMPESARNVVVLPAPFAPSSVVMPPASTARSMPNSAWVAP